MVLVLRPVLLLTFDTTVEHTAATSASEHTVLFLADPAARFPLLHLDNLIVRGPENTMRNVSTTQRHVRPCPTLAFMRDDEDRE